MSNSNTFRVWAFRLPGTWQEMDCPFECAPDGDWSEAAARAGYCEEMPRDEFRAVSIRYAERPTPATKDWPFVVTLMLHGSACHSIFVDSLPGLVELLAKLGPYDLAESLDNLADGFIEPFAERFFRAQHGHALSNICHECDPAGWQSRREHRTARKRERNQAAAENEVGGK